MAARARSYPRYRVVATGRRGRRSVCHSCGSVAPDVRRRRVAARARRHRGWGCGARRGAGDRRSRGGGGHGSRALRSVGDGGGAGPRARWPRCCRLLPRCGAAAGPPRRHHPRLGRVTEELAARVEAARPTRRVFTCVWEGCTLASRLAQEASPYSLAQVVSCQRGRCRPPPPPPQAEPRGLRARPAALQLGGSGVVGIGGGCALRSGVRPTRCPRRRVSCPRCASGVGGRARNPI